MARIILVEDDPVIGQIIADVLFKAGHAPGLIADGETAIRVMRGRPSCWASTEIVGWVEAGHER